MEESAEKWIKTILVTIVTTALLGLGTSHILMMSRMSVLENRVQSNTQSVKQINEKMDVLIESMNKLTQETIKLQQQFKYLEKGK
jgi:hypothetical protein